MQLSSQAAKQTAQKVGCIMSQFSSRSNIQLRLLNASRCVQDLINWNRSTNTVLCNNCLASVDFASYEVTYRHRATIGTGTDVTACANCTRFLSFVRPSCYCPICFRVVLDFLSTRSDIELQNIDRDSEPHIIMLERHLMTHYSHQRTDF